MAQGFYELLGVDPTAEPDALRDAYQRRLAELVRRVRVARQQGADVKLLESQERAVREAMEVLGDPARRRSYDAFLAVMDQGTLPQDAGELWEAASGGMVEPVASVALATVRALTRLQVGDPLPAPPPGYSAKQTWAVDLRETAPAPEAAVSAPSATAAETPQTKPEPPSDAAPEPTHDDIEISPIPTGLSPSLSPAVPPPPSTEGLQLDMPLPSPQVDLGLGPDGQSGLHDLFAEPAPTPAAAPAPARRGLFGKLAAFATGSGAPVVDAGPTQSQAPLSSDPIERLKHQHGVSGGFLRGVRTLRGLTLDELARSTRISTRYLGALEDDAFDRLPSATFVRGYLRQVTAVLELEDHDVIDAYMAVYHEHRG